MRHRRGIRGAGCVGRRDHVGVEEVIRWFSRFVGVVGGVNTGDKRLKACHGADAGCGSTCSCFGGRGRAPVDDGGWAGTRPHGGDDEPQPGPRLDTGRPQHHPQVMTRSSGGGPARPA